MMKIRFVGRFKVLPKFLDNLCAAFYLFHQHSSTNLPLKHVDLKCKVNHSEMSCFPERLCACLTSGLIGPSVSLCALGSHTTASSSSRTSDLTSGAITEVAENYRGGGGGTGPGGEKIYRQIFLERSEQTGPRCQNIIGAST